jgi:CDP-glucose 4,6-dehydratase
MRKLFGNFFQNKRILITGHTGFIGSWLSIMLNELGADLIGYALSPHTQNDNFVVTNLKKRMVSIIGDIRNFKKLQKVFYNYQPEVVFHLAAQPLVRKSYLY